MAPPYGRLGVPEYRDRAGRSARDVARGHTIGSGVWRPRPRGDLTRPLAADAVAAIRRAWLEHHVLVFPDQSVTDDDLERFTLAFGRHPSEEEQQAAVITIRKKGLFALCHVLLNTNEFVYLD